MSVNSCFLCMAQLSGVITLWVQVHLKQSRCPFGQIMMWLLWTTLTVVPPGPLFPLLSSCDRHSAELDSAASQAHPTYAQLAAEVTHVYPSEILKVLRLQIISPSSLSVSAGTFVYCLDVPSVNYFCLYFGLSRKLIGIMHSLASYPNPNPNPTLTLNG